MKLFVQTNKHFKNIYCEESAKNNLDLPNIFMFN